MSLNQTESEAKQILQEKLGQSPRLQGIARSRWRLQDIRQHIGWLKGITLSGVSKILKRLGFSRQRTTSFTVSPDPAYYRKFKWYKQVVNATEQAPDKIVCLYLDEFSYYLQPKSALHYAPMGQKTPKHYRSYQADTLTRIGAVVNHHTGAVLYQQGDKFGKVALMTLYQQIRQQYPQQLIYVVQDNCPFHKCDDVKRTLHQLDIVPVFLPTYASWLNPIEKLWHWLRADVLKGHPFAHSLYRLRQQVATFLDRFQKPSPSLLRYIGLLPV